ncbi:hypothetical protein PSTT_15170, partial [Puccinia striiformis]
MVNPTTEPIDIETSPSTYRQGLPDHPSATKKTQGRRPAAMKATKPAAKKPTKPVACKPPNQQLARKMLPIINRPFNQTRTLRLKTITYRQFKRTVMMKLKCADDKCHTDVYVSKVLCMTKFRFCVLDKTTAQKKVYQPIFHDNPFPFLESVVYKCEDQVKNTGSIVSDSLHTGKPVIKWSIIIPRVTRFKKDDGTTVHNEVSFTRWITALSKSNATKTTLNLSVINPTKVTEKLHQFLLIGIMDGLILLRNNQGGWHHAKVT